MLIQHFSNRQSLLMSRVGKIGFFLVILLISGCGGEEPVDRPIVESVEDEKSINDSPISTPYFPMTLGSRWVYRNADGSEWTREITETKNFGDNLYYYFTSNPPLQDTQVESLRSPVYVTFLDRLDRRIVRSDINAAIREIVVDSGGETPNWVLGMDCNKQGAGRRCAYQRRIDLRRES